MKKFLLLFFITSLSFAQNLNDYKYALVSSKFEFQKEKDQFRLNTLAKLFMQKYGFEAYLDTETLPEIFAENNCNKVFVDVEAMNTFFLTKVKVVLKDCKNNIIASSLEGSSKEKDFKVAYDQALRQAFNSFKALVLYKYNGKDVEKAYVEEKVAIVTKEIPVETESKSLYAQPINNGFQLINSEPRIVMKVYKTSVKDFFIASRDNQNGVLFLKDSVWLFEFYKEGKLVSERVDVKF
jgi:hypothetical protein